MQVGSSANPLDGGGPGTLRYVYSIWAILAADCALRSCSCKTVRLTLWGAFAEEQGASLEMEDTPIIAISACRASDFDGAPPLDIIRREMTIP